VTDTVEKGFRGGSAFGRPRKRFPNQDPESDSDPVIAPSQNWILSDHHLISQKSAFFDSIDPQTDIVVLLIVSRALAGDLKYLIA
jgi:hypothetical protein